MIACVEQSELTPFGKGALLYNLASALRIPLPLTPSCPLNGFLFLEPPDFAGAHIPAFAPHILKDAGFGNLLSKLPKKTLWRFIWSKVYFFQIASPLFPAYSFSTTRIWCQDKQNSVTCCQREIAGAPSYNGWSNKNFY
jgi:hypothetical protein